MKLRNRFPEFSIVFISRTENVLSDSLAKIARSFPSDLTILVILFLSGAPDQFEFE